MDMTTTNQTTIRKFKWIWAWDDEKEEAWLSDMARQGYHLVRALPGVYTFAVGAPQPYVYRLDFRNEAQFDRQAYVQLFADAGWELVGQMNGWYYFRKLAEGGETPEIFSDQESKVAKYQRLLTFLAVLSPLYLYMAVMVSNPTHQVFGSLVTGAMVAVLLIYIYAVVRLIMRINALKKG